MSDIYTDNRNNKEAVVITTPEGHPIHILMKEHELMEDYAQRLNKMAQEIAGSGGSKPGESAAEIDHLAHHLLESESHYVREENVLFPVLERYGITQPPRMMWIEHDMIRALKKELSAAVSGMGDRPKDFIDNLSDVSRRLLDAMSSHFAKENSILFPTALRVITEPEWSDIRRQFDELGYCCFTPSVPVMGHAGDNHLPAAGHPEAVGGGTITFETGVFSTAELSAVFDSLPVDITFVDKDDTVRYFNQSKDRIFPRAKAIIGRKVQNCHPHKSLDKVQSILDGFRSGALPGAEFWIGMGEKLIYIRYLPVRGKTGEYLGCIEVTQDIAPIKKIDGEKRLL